MDDDYDDGGDYDDGHDHGLSGGNDEVGWGVGEIYTNSRSPAPTTALLMTTLKYHKCKGVLPCSVSVSYTHLTLPTTPYV